MQRRLSRLQIVLLASWSFIGCTLAADYRVTLSAGDRDRAGQVLRFGVPGDAPEAAVLRDSSGRDLRVQIDTDGTATAVLPWQAAGTAWTFRLTSARDVAGDVVKASSADGELRLSVDGRPVLAFKTDRNRLPREDIKPEFVRAGYVHPVFSPAGRIVTDDYPSNHVHHHGIWTSWVKTKFQGRTPDFWNMQAKTGAEELVALDRSWGGAVHGGFAARLKMVDLSAPAPVVALDETWHLTVFDLTGASRPAWMFDLVVTQQCATADALVLPAYHYGGFGFRGLGAWNGPGESARFLTSEGIVDRIAGNNTRARWCYLGGLVEGGGMAGTATLGHPDNFRAPQPVRLHPNMPYFSFVPQQLGEFSIEPGHPYRARFRFVVMDGEPDRALLDAYWHGYATPADVRVEKR